ILAALHDSVRVFRDLGVDVVELALLRSPLDYCVGASHIIRTEGPANLAGLMAQDRGAFDPFVRERILAGSGRSASEYAARLIERRADRVALRAAMAGVDGLLLPTTPIAAPPVSVIDEHAMPLSDPTRFVNY